LQDLRSLLAHEVAQLRRYRVLGGVVTECEARDGDNDEQDRRDGSHSVEGDRSTTG
jgi:hypothetical protein